MRIGIKATTLEYGNDGPAIYRDLAVTADRAGIESLWLGHHVVLGSSIADEYPYTEDGVVPLNAAGDRYDPWVLFAHLGALTQRLRFGTSVYLLPMINPFLTARAVATVDQLTHGRVLLGIGVGWSQQEFANLGSEFTSRGARTDEILEILRRLWTKASLIGYEGTHYRFDPVEFQPKPFQRPYPPILVGGSDAEPVLRRAAGLNGFIFPPNVGLDVIESISARIAQMREENGRASEPFQLTAIVESGLTLDAVAQLDGLGVTRVIFEAGRSPIDADGSLLARTSEAFSANVTRAAEHLRPVMSG